MTKSRLFILASVILLLGSCTPGGNSNNTSNNSTTTSFNIPKPPSTSTPQTETKIEDFVFELNSEGTYDIVHYDNFEPLKVVIPETYEGLAVTGIKENAFGGKSSGVDTIVLSKNIKLCSPASFNNSFMVSNIEVDEKNEVYASEDGLLLNKAKTQLIYAPQGKEEITLPNSIISIADYGFKNSRAKTVTLNDGLESIGAFAFDSTKRLETLVIPNSVTTVGEEMLSTSGIKNLTIGTGVAYLPSYFLNNCDSLINLTIPGNVKTIGEVAIYENSYLQNVVLEEGVEEISYAGFANNAIVNISFPSTLKTIADEAFIRNWNIDNVIIPEGVTSIGNSAFYACDDLSKVSLPSTLTSIGFSAFSYCPSLDTITINDNNQYFCIDDNVLFSKDKTKLICYIGDHEGFDYVIPNTVEIIEREAFAGAKRLKNVTISTSVTKIGASCFGGVSYLSSVTYLGTHMEWMQIESTETKEIVDENGNSTTITLSWSDNSNISKLICSDREIPIN